MWTSELLMFIFTSYWTCYFYFLQWIPTRGNIFTFLRLLNWYFCIYFCLFLYSEITELISVKSLFKEAKVDISESVIDRAHRIGSRYLDASSNSYRKSIIICFTTLRHRTMFYRAKNKLKRAVRIKVDMTKSRYDLLKTAMVMWKRYLPLSFDMRMEIVV